MLLLAECVATRPAVLAPLALRAPGTLNAARGASKTSRRAGGGSDGLRARVISVRPDRQ
jgi:hypothetical protein